MPAYNEAYLDEVVETQGKLFAYIAYDFPDMDTKDFIESYMKSKHVTTLMFLKPM